MDESLAFRYFVLAILFAILTIACALSLGAALYKGRGALVEDWPADSTMPWALAMMLSTIHVVRFLISAYEAIQ